MGTARASESPAGTPRVTRRLENADRLNVQALFARAARHDGFWPLSDQLVADLARPSDDERRRPVAVLFDADTGDGKGDVHGSLAGYAQATRRDGGWTMQLVVEPARRVHGDEVVATLLETTLEAIAATGGGAHQIDWWVFQPSDDIAERAAAHGFHFDRDLVQMRRTLPADRRSTAATRSFVVGRDDQAWIAVNNRAFAGHPEQGAWSIETLHQRTAQPWFDPDGLRLHERDGRLAAFCWTKVHDGTAVHQGEIYVIGVDPDFQGLGLGKELTLAGLDHLSDGGIVNALLYVDGANAAARAMYKRLGFHVERTDRAYVRRVSGNGVSTPLVG